MNLIKQLKLEHVEILKLFKSILENVENKEDVLDQVENLKELLGLHLEKEDKFLYPHLAESSHEELQKLGNIFSSSMKKYSIEVLDSLNKCIVTQGEKELELLNSLKQNFTKIENRITIEEDILFPAYIKYSGNNNDS